MGENMNKAMREFLLDLADVLDKHDAHIESEERFVPYDEPGRTLELYAGSEMLDLDTSDLYGYDIRQRANK